MGSTNFSDLSVRKELEVVTRRALSSISQEPKPIDIAVLGPSLMTDLLQMSINAFHDVMNDHLLRSRYMDHEEELRRAAEMRLFSSKLNWYIYGIGDIEEEDHLAVPAAGAAVTID